jgi:hypothetical protein
VDVLGLDAHKMKDFFLELTFIVTGGIVLMPFYFLAEDLYHKCGFYTSLKNLLTTTKIAAYLLLSIACLIVWISGVYIGLSGIFHIISNFAIPVHIVPVPKSY